MATQAKEHYFPQLDDIRKAAVVLQDVAVPTPLMRHPGLSDAFDADILLKREDLQTVRSYKIRGAFNRMQSLSQSELNAGVVCASAGNHAQGVAFSCKRLAVRGTIFMPTPTPQQKISQVRSIGEEYVDIRLVGDSFDDSEEAARRHCEGTGSTLIHPFEDPKIIEGQGTVALEILEQSTTPIDYWFIPVGGGGLVCGTLGVTTALAPQGQIICLEPEGAPALHHSLQQGVNSTLPSIDPFVDGAAVRRIGEMNFNICQGRIDDVLMVPEGLVCKTILDLYTRDAIVVEPAGAMSVAGLYQYRERIRGKTVVCVVSGGNNDIMRTEEIKERALMYEGLKHYFIVRFPQRAGALKEFVEQVLGPTDDITHFEYTKKNSRIKGSAVVGIELQSKDDFPVLLSKMKDLKFFGEYLNDNDVLMDMLV